MSSFFFLNQRIPFFSLPSCYAIKKLLGATPEKHFQGWYLVHTFVYGDPEESWENTEVQWHLPHSGTWARILAKDRTHTAKSQRLLLQILFHLCVTQLYLEAELTGNPTGISPSQHSLSPEKHSPSAFCKVTGKVKVNSLFPQKFLTQS